MEILQFISLAILFLVFLLGLNALNKKNRIFTTVFTCIVFAGGYILYGIGYFQKEDNLFIAALRATNATIRMFIGTKSIDDVKATPAFQYESVMFLIEFIHFSALAITAKALLSTFSKNLSKRLRTYLVKRGNLVIIYGLNQSSIDFGELVNKNDENSVVYVDCELKGQYSDTLMDSVNGLFLTESGSDVPTRQFLKRIGALRNNRKIMVYALNEDETANIEYASKFHALLKEIKEIKKNNISLTLLANMEMDYGNLFQADENDSFGFGSVLAIDLSYLTARHLINHYPPCNYVKFDNEKALAVSDFNAVIIGFGKLGQAVLKKLVMNSQFEGSTMHITVYDPDMEKILGSVSNSCIEIFNNYDIKLKNIDARSVDFYDELKANEDVNYIAVCIGNSKFNNEIATDIQAYAIARHRNIDIFRCSQDGICYHDTKEGKYFRSSAFSRDNLDIMYADAKAMALNYMYCSNNMEQDESTPLDYWIRANYHDKMSSRASSDFITSYLSILGLDEEDASKMEELNLTEDQQENLAKTEHLRWCAFHYASGYSKMSEEMFNDRVKDFKSDIAKKGISDIKIQKDDYNRYHNCLVPWDELDRLSEEYSSVTGRNKDYKKDDLNNVLMLPKLLRICKKFKASN